MVVTAEFIRNGSIAALSQPVGELDVRRHERFATSQGTFKFAANGWSPIYIQALICAI